MSVSEPLNTPSAQLGWQRSASSGMRHSPHEQTVGASQSPGIQLISAAHGLQTTPPQSTSVSSPFEIPSKQWSSHGGTGSPPAPASASITERPPSPSSATTLGLPPAPLRSTGPGVSSSTPAPSTLASPPQPTTRTHVPMIDTRIWLPPRVSLVRRSIPILETPAPHTSAVRPVTPKVVDGAGYPR